MNVFLKIPSFGPHALNSVTFLNDQILQKNVQVFVEDLFDKKEQILLGNVLFLNKVSVENPTIWNWTRIVLFFS